MSLNPFWEGNAGDDDDDNDKDEDDDDDDEEEEEEERCDRCSDSDFEELPMPGKRPVASELYVSPSRRNKPKKAKKGKEEGQGTPPRKGGRLDREWQPFKDGGSVALGELDDYLSKLFTRKAPGRGFRVAGEVDRPDAAGNVCTLYQCKYKNCPALIKAVKFSGGIATVYKAGADALLHNDHLQDLDDPGVPGFIRAVITPSKLRWRPQQLRAYIRESHPEVARHLTKPRVQSLISLHETTLAADARKMMDKSSGRGKFGGVFAEYAKLERNLLIAKGDYTEDTTYVLGEPQISSATNLVCAALSTDNLLLNAYRQSRFGVPSYMQVDTTHRLVVEGHCVLPITTSCLMQHAHVIAYGICSKEDTAAHVHVIAVTRDAVNAIVRERALAKLRV